MGTIGRIIAPLFSVVWLIFFISIFVTIIKNISKQQKVTKEVFKTAQDTLKQVHTGNPYNTVYKEVKKEPATSDDFSEVRERDSDTFDSDLNPSSQPKRVYTSKRTKVNGRRVRGDRSYSVNSSERPSHSKLSRESRDDEKEWF